MRNPNFTAFVVFLCCFSSSDAFSRSPKVNGELTTTGGQQMLRVWGSHHEMGYAHGYLLGKPIIDVVENYAVAHMGRRQYEIILPIFTLSARVSPQLKAEAQGMLSGIKASVGAHVRALRRTLTVDDILMINAYTDLLSIGCSSVSAWGQATRDDPGLRGQVALVRNLDWPPKQALLRNQIIIAYEPSRNGARNLVSVAFAGYMGCLSCMNDAGVVSTFNMGYGTGAAGLFELWRGFQPANLLLRDAMHNRSDISGVQSAILNARHAGSYILHLVGPRRKADTSAPAVIMEVEAKGIEVRYARAQQTLGTAVLAATNHLRKRAVPQVCSRYATIEKHVKRLRGKLSITALWAIAKKIYQGTSTIQSMLFLPDARRISIQFRETHLKMGNAVEYRWERLFPKKASK